MNNPLLETRNLKPHTKNCHGLKLQFCIPDDGTKIIRKVHGTLTIQQHQCISCPFTITQKWFGRFPYYPHVQTDTVGTVPQVK